MHPRIILSIIAAPYSAAASPYGHEAEASTESPSLNGTTHASSIAPHNNILANDTTLIGKNDTQGHSSAMNMGDKPHYPPGKFPYRELPQCYIGCFESKRYKFWSIPLSVPMQDVLALSTEELCWTYYYSFEIWGLHALAECTSSACANANCGSLDCHVRAHTTLERICKRHISF